MSDLYQLIYVSSSIYLLDEEELSALLSDFRTNNASHGITGILLYKDGNIMQVIEGEKQSILQLSENIKKDPRHKGMIILCETGIPAREFGEWSMSYHNISGVVVEGFTSFIEHNNKTELERSVVCSKAKRLLLSFKNT